MLPDDSTPIVQTDAAPKDWSSASDEEILNTDLVVALGLETLSDEDKLLLAEQMTSTVQKAVTLNLLNSLTPEKKAQLDQLLEENDADKINAFLADEVPDFANMVQEETIKFKRAMLTEGSNN
jgi:hypothetical protein